MKKINRNQLNEMWDMRNLTVKEFFENLSKHPDLKFLLTAAGIWWLTKFALAITIAGNVIYYVIRIFNLVLG
ncbi:MAG: hypothetical protein ACYCQI_09420 [Gammaproteobacteria bacterium]